MTSRAETLSRYNSSKESATLLPDIGDAQQMHGHDGVVGALGGLLISKKISMPSSDTDADKDHLDASRSNEALKGKGLKQCASPVRRTTTTVNELDGKNSNVNPSDRAIGTIGREITSEKPISLPLRSLSGGSSRGDPSISQTRSSFNSLKKSKIPGPVRRSLDQNLTPLTPAGDMGGELDASSSARLGTGLSGSSSSLARIIPSRDLELQLDGDGRLGLLRKSTSGTGIAPDISGIAPGGKSERISSKVTKNFSCDAQTLAASRVPDPGMTTTTTTSSASSTPINNTSTLRSSTNTLIEHATSFQAACKARVASQKKSLQSAFAAGSAAGAAAGGGAGQRGVGVGLSAKDTRTVLRESAAASETDAKRRKRAEIYAINNFLKQREMERYAAFQAEQDRLLNSDDISWCSADSSLMPTPRYRSEKERRYDPTASSPSRSSKAKSMGGV
jgi:hypothetical protein